MDADPAKGGSARRALTNLLPNTRCYTLETSFYAASDGGPHGGPRPLALADYVALGRHLGEALCDYFNIP